jgi:hypothetical protein
MSKKNNPFIMMNIRPHGDKVLSLAEESKACRELIFSKYKEQFYEAIVKEKLNLEHALVPGSFLLGTDKSNYFLPAIEMAADTKEMAVAILRNFIKDRIIKGETPRFYFHFSEVRTYQMKTETEEEKMLWEYFKRTGTPFPGSAHLKSQFAVTYEEVNNYSMDIFDIHPVTGKLTRDPITSINKSQLDKDIPDKNVTMETAKNPEEGYTGIFTHIVYKPDEAPEVKEENTFKVVSREGFMKLEDAKKALDELKNKKTPKRGLDDE